MVSYFMIVLAESTVKKLIYSDYLSYNLSKNRVKAGKLLQS